MLSELCFWTLSIVWCLKNKNKIKKWKNLKKSKKSKNTILLTGYITWTEQKKYM